MLTNLKFLDNISFTSFNPKFQQLVSLSVEIHTSIIILSFPNIMDNLCKQFDCALGSVNKEEPILCRRSNNTPTKLQTKKKLEAHIVHNMCRWFNYARTSIKQKKHTLCVDNSTTLPQIANKGEVGGERT